MTEVKWDFGGRLILFTGSDSIGQQENWNTVCGQGSYLSWHGRELNTSQSGGRDRMVAYLIPVRLKSYDRTRPLVKGKVDSDIKSVLITKKYCSSYS